MDGRRFDDLTKSLAVGVSRRSLVRGLIGGAAGAIVARLGHEASAAPNRCSVFCADQPGPRKAACKQACRACNSDPSLVCQNFDTGEFACCPEGQGCFGGVCCESPDQVCFGDNGAVCCEPGTFCDQNTGQCGPPATCGPESGCLGGTCNTGCFCVSSVEGNGACVNSAFANCDAPTCVTSDDCGPGGVCVDATDCCGVEVQVCFPPEGICGVGLTTSSTNSTPGWHR